MVEIEAVGEALGGAMAGRAVEPVPDGKGGEKLPGPGDCLNCATPLGGRNYCHHCGQKATVHRTLKGLAHDVLHGVLHLDGKVWRTLPMLFVAPGELTRRYVRGQRARFISPIAVYLFSVVAMFAFVISLGEINTDGFKPEAVIQGETVEQQQKIVDKMEENLAELEAEEFPGAEAMRSGLAAQLEDARDHLATLEREAANVDATEEEDEFDPLAGDETELDETSETAETGASPVDDAGIVTGGDVNILGMAPEELRAVLLEVQSNPALYLYKVQTKAYKLSWLLIPLSLPFMFLLFPFSRRFKMYDHAVFVTYSISFMMLLVLSLAALGAIFSPGDWMAWALLLPPLHMYRQLRGAYSLSRGGALVRTVLLLVFSFVTLALFIALMLGLGVM